MQINDGTDDDDNDDDDNDDNDEDDDNAFCADALSSYSSVSLPLNTMLWGKRRLIEILSHSRLA